MNPQSYLNIVSILSDGMGKKLLIAILAALVCALSFGRSFLGLIGIVPWH
jgi:hypothetical protein